VLWGATAELAGKALQKGDRVGISGRLSQDEWEDKATGKKQRKTKITGENMTLLSPKREQSETRQQSVNTPKNEPKFDDDESDDLPF
jgi:single stranded DNA-binding protein